MADTDTPPNTGGTGLRTKMYGVPLWGWIGIAGAAAIVIGLWLQSRKKAAPAPTTDTSTFAGPDTGQWEAIMTQIRDLQGQPSTPATTTSDVADNATWYKNALAWWSKEGYKGTTPLHVQIALNDYLTGKPLGAWEQWVVNTAIQGGEVTDWNTKKQVKYGTGIGAPPEQIGVKFG